MQIWTINGELLGRAESMSDIGKACRVLPHCAAPSRTVSHLYASIFFFKSYHAAPRWIRPCLTSELGPGACTPRRVASGQNRVFLV